MRGSQACRGGGLAKEAGKRLVRGMVGEVSVLKGEWVEELGGWGWQRRRTTQAGGQSGVAVRWDHKPLPA